MVTINKSKTVSAPLDQVWNIISNLDETKYWSGMRKIKVLTTKGNTVEREATVGFLEKKSRQTLVRNPKKSIIVTMTKGPMQGKREIVLTPIDGDTTKVSIRWEFELVGMPNFVKGYVEDHIDEGTDKALDGIAVASGKQRIVSEV